MKITKENYEIYFVDYFDGVLSDKETRMLFDFLQQHPALKEEFESFDNTPLKADKSIVFTGKSDLKKTEIIPHQFINENNYEEYFIAFSEKDLSENEQEVVLAFLFMNPQLETIFNLYATLKLKPDAAITYSNKEALKHQPKKRAIFWLNPYMKIAAGLLLLLGLYIVFNTQFHQKRSEKVFTLSAISSDDVNTQITPYFEENIQKKQTHPIVIESSHPNTKDESNTLINNGLPNRKYQEAYKIKPLHEDDLILLTENVEDAIHSEMNYRYKATISYLYHKRKSDKLYQLALLNYQEKNDVEKVIYQLANRWFQKDNDYIISPSDYEFVENANEIKQLAHALGKETIRMQEYIKLLGSNLSFSSANETKK